MRALRTVYKRRNLEIGCKPTPSTSCRGQDRLMAWGFCLYSPAWQMTTPAWRRWSQTPRRVSTPALQEYLSAPTRICLASPCVYWDKDMRPKTRCKRHMWASGKTLAPTAV